MLRQKQERVTARDPIRPQDAELFLLSASSAALLSAKAAQLGIVARDWSNSEFVLAARESVCNARLIDGHRAAVVATSPMDLAGHLLRLANADQSTTDNVSTSVFWGQPGEQRRVVFAFHHVAPAETHASQHWRKRFRESAASIAAAKLQTRFAGRATDSATMESVTASLAGWQLLERCNIKPDMVLGIGRGELLACAVAGVVDEDDVMPLAVELASRGCLAGTLTDFALADPTLRLVSASLGRQVRDSDEARALLTKPFGNAQRSAAKTAIAGGELVIELGADAEWSALFQSLGAQTVSLDAHSGPVSGLLKAVGAAFTAGVPVNAAALYEDRPLAALEQRMLEPSATSLRQRLPLYA